MMCLGILMRISGTSSRRALRLLDMMRYGQKGKRKIIFLVSLNRISPPLVFLMFLLGGRISALESIAMAVMFI
jgi:hypothetical protein